MFIKEAVFPRDTQSLKSLIHEYVGWLDMDLSYRGFDEEMARMEDIFRLPSGLFLIACHEDTDVGCVGLKRHDTHIAEVKRLYVKPGFRENRTGYQLMGRLIERAATLGFKRLILDAVPQTIVAQRLYRSMGFSEIGAYYDNPVEGTKFFELCLPVN